jgi:hypothetical protein
VDVQEVVADGAVVAVLFTVHAGGLVSRGTVVATLGELDRVTSLRLYSTWATAVLVDDVQPAVDIGRR